MQKTEIVSFKNTEFMMLGNHEFGYIKKLNDNEIEKILGDADYNENVNDLFALYTADGSRMVVAETYEEVRASAWKYGLETMTLH